MVAGRRIRHVVGGDDVHVALGGKRHERVVAPHIERVTVVPHLDEHAVAAECLDEQLERSSRGVRSVGVQRSRERALGGTGEHEALAAHALRERLDIKDGVRLCSAKLAVGERLRQSAVAGGAVGDDDEIAKRVLECISARVVARHFGTEHRAQAHLSRGLRETHGAVEPVAISDGERAQPEFVRDLRQALGRRGAVQERELRATVQLGVLTALRHSPTIANICS